MKFTIILFTLVALTLACNNFTHQLSSQDTFGTNNSTVNSQNVIYKDFIPHEQNNVDPCYTQIKPSRIWIRDIIHVDDPEICRWEYKCFN